MYRRGLPFQELLTLSSGSWLVLLFDIAAMELDLNMRPDMTLDMGL